MKATAYALEYFPDAVGLDSKGIIGRIAAGAGLLRAAIAHDAYRPAAIALTSPENSAALDDALKRFGLQASKVPRMHLGDLAGLGRIGCLLTMSPEIGELAWRRRLASEDSYSVVGLTHTLCVDRVVASISRLLIDPVQPWDALICTSQAARKAVLRIVDAYRDYLAERGISTPPPALQMPVIPLGVDCARFNPGDRAAARTRFRTAHGVGERDVAVLSFGRINPLTKAQPVPMILALRGAQAMLKDDIRLHLFVAGQTPSPRVDEDFAAAVAEFGGEVAVHRIDGADDEASRDCWHAADMFISLVDNIQETFGLTVIEAMAAGLPVIASDWSGYRDTVEDGETGVLIPTAMPAAGGHLGIFLADRYAAKIDDYAIFAGSTAQTVAVETAAAAEAIAGLAGDRQRRLRMGRAARARAEANFDWPCVLAQMLALFGELAEIRKHASGVGMRDPMRAAAFPACPDPFAMFEGFPTRCVDRETRFAAAPGKLLPSVDLLYSQRMTSLGGHFRLPRDKIREMLELFQKGPLSIGDAIERMEGCGGEQVVATCLWLAKYGILACVEGASGEPPEAGEIAPVDAMISSPDSPRPAR